LSIFTLNYLDHQAIGILDEDMGISFMSWFFESRAMVAEMAAAYLISPTSRSKEMVGTSQ